MLKVDAVPALFLVDANGAIRYVHVGYDESEASGMETGLRERVVGLKNDLPQVS